MEGAACTGNPCDYIRPGIFMPPMMAFMRAFAASEAERKASFTAAVAGGRGLHHAAAGGGLEGHGGDLLLSGRGIALHLLSLLHHLLHIHKRDSFCRVERCGLL